MADKFYWIIDFFLILIVLFLSMKTYEEWINPRPKEKGIVVAKAKAVVPPTPVPPAQKGEVPGPASFKIISEKNLFSPDRKEFPIPMPETKDTRMPTVRPNLTLYGVVIGTELSFAMINNPNRKGKERENMTVKVGDKVGGDFTVTQILEDRITLENQGDSFDVLLYDASKPKRRVVPVPVPVPVEKPIPAPVVPGRPLTPSPEVAPTPVPVPGISPTPGPIPPGGELPGRRSLRERLEQRRLQRMEREMGSPGSIPMPQGSASGQGEEGK